MLVEVGDHADDVGQVATSAESRAAFVVDENKAELVGAIECGLSLIHI